jgi:hypothetical protein
LKTHLKESGIKCEERSLDDDILLEAQKLGVRSLPAVRIPEEGKVLSTSSVERVKEFMANIKGGGLFRTSE